MTTSGIVAVGGTNPLKIRGTMTGLERLVSKGFAQAHLTVRGTEACSFQHVPPQPIGMRQTRLGALYRACAALVADPDAQYGVGLENGIVLLSDEVPAMGGLDVPVVAIVHRPETYRSATYAAGPGTPVEGKYIVASLASGQQTTCGELISKATGFSHVDWITGYTSEAIDREETLSVAVYLGFAAFFNDH